jgi:glycosyltransferase involved in cell wall biosynthesis
MSSNTKVAIITPNFNKGEVVEDCIKSVLAQSHKNWELWFVDDNSTDNSFELARKYTSDARCHFLVNDTGMKGASVCRNIALEATDAEFVIYLDSDDILVETCLENRLRDFEGKSELGFISYPMGLFFDRLGDMDFISNIPTEESDLHRFLKRDMVWLISGPMWRKKTLEQLGGFDLSLESQQDYDLHLRSLIADIPYLYIHRSPDVYYRRNVDSLPRQNSQTIDHLRQRYQMVLNHERLFREKGRLGEKEGLLLARNILDLAQMMRWHLATLGRDATEEAKQMWLSVKELKLIPDKMYRNGLQYLKFKHNMKYNHVPSLANFIENRFRKKLGELIHTPSTKYCKVRLSDYQS